MTASNLQLKKRIMRRVYAVWFMREVAPPLALQLLVLGALLVGIHEFVSVKFVLRNALHSVSGIPSLIDFAAAAIRNTGFIPQILLTSSFLLAALILRDLRKMLRRVSLQSRVLQFARSR